DGAEIGAIASRLGLLTHHRHGLAAANRVQGGGFAGGTAADDDDVEAFLTHELALLLLLEAGVGVEKAGEGGARGGAIPIEGAHYKVGGDARATGAALSDVIRPRGVGECPA